MTATWIWAQLALSGVAALLAVAVPARWRSVAAGSAVAVQGAAGVVAGAVVLGGGSGLVELAPGGLPLVSLGSLSLAPDALGALFLLVVSAVALVAAVFGIGYAEGAAASRSGWVAFAVFVLGLQLVPQAGDVVTFLLAWEVMAVASTVLVLADHRERPEVRGAGLWYAAMTHLSFLLLVSGFGVLAAHAGSVELGAIAADPPGRRAGHGGLVAPGSRVPHQGRCGPGPRLAAAGPPRGAEPCLGRDERGHGEDRRVRRAAGELAPAARRAPGGGRSPCW